MNGIAVATSSVFSIVAVLVLFFWLYRQMRLDVFRQKLFALRDELFDVAADGKIDFRHPAYGMLRSTINGTIRFGHRLNLPFAIYLSIRGVSRKNKDLDSFSARLAAASASLTPDQKKLICDYRQRLNIMMVEHVILASPALLVSVIIPVLFFAETQRRVALILRTVRRPIERIDALALASAEA